MFNPKSLLIPFLYLSFGAGVTALLITEEDPIKAGQQSSLDVSDYRLVGYQCGPEGRTVLSREESDFDMDCKEIVRLEGSPRERE